MNSLFENPIQPNEVIFVYLNIEEQYEVWEESDDDCVGFGFGSRRVMRKYHYNHFIGAVIDDHTLRILKSRAEPYAREEEEKMISSNKHRTEYTVSCEYTFETKKRIVIPESTLK